VAAAGRYVVVVLMSDPYLGAADLTLLNDLVYRATARMPTA
jgi:hypothetical protein